ncbi:MAG TPA: cupin domain-containing protein [Mycobacterium sp.]|nr:cupin domain-containing protein [Mycobacterium sp.]
MFEYVRDGEVTVDSPLAWLLEPLPVQTFFDELWEKTHHHLKRDCAGYFDRVLPGPSAVDELLKHAAPEPSMLRLVRGKDKREADRYRLADGSLDLARVQEDFADGHTIILNGIEQYVPTIASLAHALEVELNFPAKVNAYATPPGSQGFAPHYDAHNVLILQIHGSKIWHLYGTPTPPHQMQSHTAVVAADLPAPQDVLLEAGDVFYLPRGVVHSAETTSEPSVHLTIGMHAPSALTLLSHMLYLLSVQDDRLHRLLPPRHLDDGDARAGIAGLVRDMADIIEDPDVVAAGLGALEGILVRRGSCPPVGRVSDAVGIDGHTLVTKHQPLYSRVTPARGGVTLQFAQLSISAGADHEAALRFLAGSTEPFRVADLPGLGATQQTDLARKLIATGFLVRLPH